MYICIYIYIYIYIYILLAQKASKSLKTLISLRSQRDIMKYILSVAEVTICLVKHKPYPFKNGLLNLLFKFYDLLSSCDRRPQ